LYDVILRTRHLEVFVVVEPVTFELFLVLKFSFAKDELLILELVQELE
jgi:hypothetical protein